VGPGPALVKKKVIPRAVNKGTDTRHGTIPSTSQPRLAENITHHIRQTERISPEPMARQRLRSPPIYDESDEAEKDTDPLQPEGTGSSMSYI
jgi:hypothetical protein